MILRQINFSVFVARDGSHVDAVAASWEDGRVIGMEISEALQRMTVDEIAHFWAAFEALATEACTVLHEKTGVQNSEECPRCFEENGHVDGCMNKPQFSYSNAEMFAPDDAEILEALHNVRAP